MTMTQTEVNVPVDGTITSAKLSGDLVTPSNLTVTGTATMDGLVVSGAQNSKVAYFDDSSESGYRQLQFTSSNNGQYWDINSQGTSGGLGGVLTLSTRNTERMRIDTSGNVGIGTDTIIGSAANRGVLTLSGASSSFLTFGTGSTRWGGVYSSASSTIFLSDSISTFETGGVERMRIDSSGNLLVGKTAADNTTAGTRIHPAGYASFTIANDYPIIANRLSSDGDIAVFRKDSTTVGSIGSEGGNSLYIANDDAGLRFSGGSNCIIPCGVAGASSDGLLDLGLSGLRFKDLYLSGKSIVGSGSFDGGGVIHNYGSDGNSRSWWTKTDTHGYGDFAIRQSTTQTGSTYQTRLLIDSSGNLLVGKTSTSQTTAGTVLYNNGQAYSTASGTQASVLTRLSNDGPIQIFYKDSSEVGRIGSNAAGGTPVLDISANSSSGIMRMLTSGTERMRITSAGSLMVNSTTNYGKFVVENGGNSYPVWFRNTSSAIDYPNRIMSNYATGGQTATMLQFLNGGSAAVGAIKSTASSTSYVTSSDQRLKENIADADDAGSKIDAIQVRQYDWKVDGSHQDYGMVAQELQAVAPEAVSGDADSEEMMGVDYSKLVPMLIKEIQSLRNRVAQLEA